MKPGLFATASIQQPVSAPALLVPATAVETVAGTSRVYVVKDGKADERIVTIGETVGNQSKSPAASPTGDVVAAAPKGASSTVPRCALRYAQLSDSDFSFQTSEETYQCSGSQRFPSNVPFLPAS